MLANPFRPDMLLRGLAQSTRPHGSNGLSKYFRLCQERVTRLGGKLKSQVEALVTVSRPVGGILIELAL
jgi:hypothetical protein